MPYPASGLSIRGADEEKYTVIDVSATEFGVRGLILEETEISRALFELYEGAIVSWATSITMLLPHSSSVAVPAPGQNLHREYLPEPLHPDNECVPVERKFQVREINHDSKQARLIRTDVDWLTMPRYVLSGVVVFFKLREYCSHVNGSGWTGISRL